MLDARKGTNVIEGADIAIGGGATAEVIQGAVALTSTVSNTTSGVSMIVRLVVKNNNYETLTASTIELSIAGEDFVGTYDITDDGTDCIVPTSLADAAADDETSRTITPRPTLDDTTDGTVIILDVDGIATP